MPQPSPRAIAATSPARTGPSSAAGRPRAPAWPGSRAASRRRGRRPSIGARCDGASVLGKKSAGRSPARPSAPIDIAPSAGRRRSPPPARGRRVVAATTLARNQKRPAPAASSSPVQAARQTSPASGASAGRNHVASESALTATAEPARIRRRRSPVQLDGGPRLSSGSTWRAKRSAASTGNEGRARARCARAAARPAAVSSARSRWLIAEGVTCSVPASRVERALLDDSAPGPAGCQIELHRQQR